MTENQRQQVVQTLRNYGLDVRTDENYHGVNVDVIAESRSSDKRVFAYVVEENEPLLGHAINLSNIREGNTKYFKRTNCAYMIVTDKEATRVAKSLSDKTGIKLLKDEDAFKQAVQEYLEK